MTAKHWGGDWTEEKLDAFKKYVDAYLTIMLAQRRESKSWPREIIYFDGFAGGTKTRTKDDEDNKLPLDIELLEGEKLYSSSPEIVLSLEKSFDKYIFVDISKKRCKDLNKTIKERFQSKENQCEVICGDTNEILVKFAEECKTREGLVSLVMLDPFGMEVKWKTIESLKGLRIDLWVLFPSGVAINRLLDKNGNIRYSEALEEFYGLPLEEIKKEFYSVKIENLVFGPEEIVEKCKNSVQKSVELYEKRLKTIWGFTRKLELRNTKNFVIFHFIFASNNKTAAKIAGQIIERKKRN